jgi:hypothetical protein
VPLRRTVTSPALSVQGDATLSRRTHSQVGSEWQGVGTNAQAACPPTRGPMTPGGARPDTATEGRSSSQNSMPVAHSDGPHAKRCGGAVVLEQNATARGIAATRARIPRDANGRTGRRAGTMSTSSFDVSLFAADPDERGRDDAPDGSVRHRTVKNKHAIFAANVGERRSLGVEPLSYER